jgi:hypothetical protein
LKQTERLIRTFPESTEGRIDGRHEGADIGKHLGAENLSENPGENTETGCRESA